MLRGGARNGSGTTSRVGRRRRDDGRLRDTAGRAAAMTRGGLKTLDASRSNVRLQLLVSQLILECHASDVKPLAGILRVCTGGRTPTERNREWQCQ